MALMYETLLDLKRERIRVPDVKLALVLHDNGVGIAPETPRVIFTVSRPKVPVANVCTLRAKCIRCWGARMCVCVCVCVCTYGGGSHRAVASSTTPAVVVQITQLLLPGPEFVRSRSYYDTFPRNDWILAFEEKWSLLSDLLEDKYRVENKLPQVLLLQCVVGGVVHCARAHCVSSLLLNNYFPYRFV